MAGECTYSPTQQQTSNCWLCCVDCGGGDVSGGWWRPARGLALLSVPRMVQRSPSPPACSRQQPGQTRGWCWATVLLLAAAPVTLASKLEFKHHNNTELAAILQQVTRRDSCCVALHHQHMDGQGHNNKAEMFSIHKQPSNQSYHGQSGKLLISLFHLYSVFIFSTVP